MILAMGTTVSAEPAPKPAAVSPAARPRRSGNHLSALPTEVQPYCRLAIITMQTMRKTSCPQRIASDASGRADAPAATDIIIGLLLFHRHLYAPYRGFARLHEQPRRLWLKNRYGSRVCRVNAHSMTTGAVWNRCRKIGVRKASVRSSLQGFLVRFTLVCGS